jgi:hypothetical protein
MLNQQHLICVRKQLEDRCTQRFVHMPEQLEAHTFYGRVLKFIELALPAGTITGGSHGSRSPGVERDPSQIILLAVMGTIKLVAKNQLGFLYYNCKDMGAMEVINASCIDYLVGRVKECDRWAI